VGIRPAHLRVHHVAGGADEGRSPVFTNAELFAAIIFEVIQLGFLAWFLRIRGWTLEKFGLAFSWSGTIVGLALLAVTYALVVGVGYVAQVVFHYDVQAASRGRRGSTRP
jgi:hypothetical protein